MFAIIRCHTGESSIRKVMHRICIFQMQHKALLAAFSMRTHAYHAPYSFRMVSLLQWQSNLHKPILSYCPENLSNIFLLKQCRELHCSASLFIKEPSKVEETVKILKENQKFKQDQNVISDNLTFATTSIAPKRSLAKRIADELLHYYHGFRLMFIDLKVSLRLAWKILHGGDLTRREHRQLVRTVSDLFRLLPFSVFIIVPFMELLLPVALKLFPAMLPSTFQTSSDKELKFKNQLKVKLEMAKFLQDTLNDMALQSKGDAHSQNAKEFVEFFEKIRQSGEQASNKEILKFSKLFEDEITLDSLSRPQVIALCRLLELKPIGTNNFLRFQLRTKLRSLKADDQMIKKEGIDCLTVHELQAACRARGMRALGIPEERLRSHLQQWLELSLDEQIPPSLLLLSRALYLSETLPTPDQLKATISTLPDVAATEAKYKIGEMEGKVDNKTKLELIKREEEEIKKEAEEREQELLDDEKQKSASKTSDMLHGVLQPKLDVDKVDVKDLLQDTAPILEDKAQEFGKIQPKTAKTEGELSKEDFDDLEDALENIAHEKKKLLIEKEELEDLKEEMAEYKQDIEEFKDMVLETGRKEIHESKAALRLSNKVNKMITKMDKFLETLTVERKSLQQQIDDKVKEGVIPIKERDDIISINELVLAIRRIQKVSDNTRLQRIVDVLERMDVDHDGAVEIDHVLKVIELLGEENVKVTGKQMNEIIELLMKEDTLEHDEKMQKQKQNVDSSNSRTIVKDGDEKTTL